MTGHIKTALWHWRWGRQLHKLSAARSGKMVLPDGMDGWVHIEWLLLRPEGLFMLETLEGAGKLIAGDALPDWTLVGRRRFVFPSPLPELQRKLTALRLLAGKTPVKGLVVLSDRLELARAHPCSVIAFAQLEERMPSLGSGSSIPPAYAQSWDRLLAASRPG